MKMNWNTFDEIDEIPRFVEIVSPEEGLHLQTTLTGGTPFIEVHFIEQPCAIEEASEQELTQHGLQTAHHLWLNGEE
jgi:hypothetical protein